MDVLLFGRMGIRRRRGEQNNTNKAIGRIEAKTTPVFFNASGAEAFRHKRKMKKQASKPYTTSETLTIWTIIGCVPRMRRLLSA